MGFRWLAEKLMRKEITEQEMLQHFSYRQKRTMKDVEKYKAKTMKDMGVHINAGSIGYLASYLSMILRDKNA